MESLKKAIVGLSIMFLCVGFLGIGMLKLVNYPSIVTSFQKWGLPVFSGYVIGFLELLIAIGIFYKPTRKLAVISAFILMLGASTVHVYFKEYGQLYGPSVVIMFLALLTFSDDLI